MFNRCGGGGDFCRFSSSETKNQKKNFRQTHRVRYSIYITARTDSAVSVELLARLKSFAEKHSLRGVTLCGMELASYWRERKNSYRKYVKSAVTRFPAIYVFVHPAGKRFERVQQKQQFRRKHKKK